MNAGVRVGNEKIGVLLYADDVVVIIMRCTHCLLFGHGNISCNGRAHCKKFSGFHDTDGCVREEHCLFYGPGHRPTSKQYLAHLQAVHLQELQHDKDHSLLDIKRWYDGNLGSDIF
ncbi:hypothetical protein E2C01_064391 [Portunus trituberculatus]|uniref:Uncharacterized protein n=1 Tax=Portunus trituberculatus TaxID=210409 RepID=A0A5B7HG30_PORTR|nr:hypothetical protein [Portunus trituberculatus]